MDKLGADSQMKCSVMFGLEGEPCWMIAAVAVEWRRALMICEDLERQGYVVHIEPLEA